MNTIPPLDDATFRLLRGLLEERFGVRYEDNQRDLLALKLAPRLQALGLSSFLDYYYYLRYDPQAVAEWPRAAAAIAVNETYFFREPDQINAVAYHLVPRWQAAHPGQVIRIWHAGCASGEEPYTMAIVLTESGAFERGPIDILGTDMNPQALDIAFRGVYRPRSFRATPPEVREKYFEPLDENQWVLKETIRQRVRFFQLNLMDMGAMARLTGIHVIFCRNVFIYFSPQNIRKVSEAFARSLREDGWLFLGAAESLLKISDRFELAEIGGAFGYRKAQER